jgi:hypothetical protein
LAASVRTLLYDRQQRKQARSPLFHGFVVGGVNKPFKISLSTRRIAFPPRSIERSSFLPWEIRNRFSSKPLVEVDAKSTPLHCLFLRKRVFFRHGRFASKSTRPASLSIDGCAGNLHPFQSRLPHTSQQKPVFELIVLDVFCSFHVQRQPQPGRLFVRVLAIVTA